MNTAVLIWKFACAPALIAGKEIHANAVCMMPPRVVARV